MKRAVSTVLALLVFASAPLLTAARAQQNIGEIAGTAVVEGRPLAKITVRLRNVDSGRLEGTQITNDRGEFRFTNLPAGNYVVETVAPGGGTLLGTSTRISLATGGMLATGVTVSTSAAAAAAAGLGAGAAGFGAGAGAAGAGVTGAAAGAGAGAAAAGATAGGAFFTTTAGIVTAVAAGAGLAAAVAVAATASPSS